MWVRLLVVALATFLVNIPFGSFRARYQRFSWPWLLAVHLPVPFVVGIRLIGGVGWTWQVFPVLAAAYCGGQFLGSHLRPGVSGPE